MNEGKKYRYEHEWRTLTEIARMTGIGRGVLDRRIKRGMTLTEALSPPQPVQRGQPVRRAPRMITFAGMTMSIPQWAEHLGINTCTLRDRLDMHGWPIERALTEPVMDFNKRTQRSRNAKIIRRMLAAVNASTTTADTPRYSTTFPTAMDTGGGRHVRHLQTEKELSP